MFGTLDHNQIEQLLHHQLIGRIGCHDNDQTYVVPISYAYDGVYIYGHTEIGKKVHMMRHNPKVCFQVDEMENMANWKSVIAWGEYEELTDTTKRNQAIEKLLDRILPHISSKTVQLSPHWPFAPTDLSNIKGIVFRIRIHERTGRFENIDTTAGYAS